MEAETIDPRCVSERCVLGGGLLTFLGCIVASVISSSPSRQHNIYGQIKTETRLCCHFINISAKLINNWPLW